MSSTTAGMAVAPRRSRIGHDIVETSTRLDSRHYPWRGQATSRIVP
jgi:hypothetical protein